MKNARTGIKNAVKNSETVINIFTDYPRAFDNIDFLIKNIHALKCFNLGFLLFNKQMALTHFTR